MSRWSLWASLSSSAKLDTDLDCWFVKQGCLANTLREFSLSNQDQASSWEFWLRTGVRAGHTYVFRILCWFWRLRISGLSGKGQTRGRGWADYCYCCCCWVAQSWPTLFTPWTVACQAPLCMGFPRQEYWSELPCPTPGDLPDPGIEPVISCTGRQIPYHCTTWETWINR